VTDVEIFKAKAVTTIKGGGFDKESKSEKKDAPDDADSILKFVLWISSLSVLLGSGTSIAGGLLARKRKIK
jgi:hypothetical protein